MIFIACETRRLIFIIKGFTMKNNEYKSRLSVREIVLFAILGTLMVASKKAMEFLPNIHMLGLFVMSITIVYRVRALIPIYIYIFLDGLLGGFALWWIPYLYIWTVLWGFTMLIPKNISSKAAMIVYPAVCSLHGILFGTLYAPAQAIMFGLSFKKTIAWIVAGVPFDIIHAVSNFCMGLMVLPLSNALLKLENYYTGANK